MMCRAVKCVDGKEEDVMSNENINKRLVVIDGSSLMYRAFFALPLLSTPSGIYTNAIYGFSNMLLKLFDTLKPDMLVIAFDKGKHTFRTDMFPEYKGTRQKTPPELSAQIPILHELAEACGIEFIEMENYEADDIIGTIATKGAQEGYDVRVVTGDRDAFQLIRDGITVMYTKKGISELAEYNVDKFEEEYGLSPIQLIDLKGLMGDTSDNIPGVPGVGPKTATKLLAAYGSVEEVLLHIEEISGKKLKENLRDNQEQALLSKRLATINCDVPMEFEVEKYIIFPSKEGIESFSKKYSIRSLSRIFDKISMPAEVSDSLESFGESHIELPAYTEITSIDDAHKVIETAKNAGAISFVLETEGDVPNMCLSGIAVAYNSDKLEICYAGEGSPACKLMFDFISTVENLKKYTFGLKPFYHLGGKGVEGLEDLELFAYLLNPEASKYDLSELMKLYCPAEGIPEEIAPGKETSVWQAFCIMKLYGCLESELEARGQRRLYDEIELPLVEVLADMESIGIAVNRQHLNEKSEEVSAYIKQLEEDIYILAGKEFNINSPKQLGEVLFERLELPVIKKTKTGYSTNAEVLEELKNRSGHPIVDKILSYRLWMKLKSTYLDGIGALINKDTGRVYTHFNQTVTATGRLSSSDPNLQNIPVRREEGKAIRALFEPGEGYDYILSADYSQIELRILAHLSGDINFVESFNNGEDIHARTASEVFGVPMDQVTSEMRRHAKAVNFGIVYGISDYGLSKDLNITRKAAAGYIESYFEKCGGIKAFIDKTVAEAKKNGYVTTMFGRRRELPNIHSSNFNQRSMAERMAMNTPIQGSAADVIKLAMIASWKAIKDVKLNSRILLQVHDELVLEVKKDELETVEKILQDTMENVVKLSIPLVTDMSYGENWAAAK